jgi:excisionase family DNA binding protein
LCTVDVDDHSKTEELMHETLIATADDAELYLFFTVAEVAQIMRTTPKAIYAQTERGLLPGATRVGRRLLFRRAVLLDWLRQKSAPSPNRSER